MGGCLSGKGMCLGGAAFSQPDLISNFQGCACPYSPLAAEKESVAAPVRGLGRNSNVLFGEGRPSVLEPLFVRHLSFSRELLSVLPCLQLETTV